MRLPSKIAIAALIGAVVALPGAAHAAYPGANGKIAFERAGQIWTINPDGTGETQLTTGPFAFVRARLVARRLAHRIHARVHARVRAAAAGKCGS